MKHTINSADFRKKKGISLLEAVFTLLIIAAMILATVAYFRQAEHQNQITALLSEIKGLIQAAEAYNDAHGSFDGITIEDIAAAHTIVPRYNVIGTVGLGNTKYLIDPWTGLGADNMASTPSITIRTYDKDHLAITINQLPSFACEQVLNQLEQFMSLHVNNGNRDNKTYCVYLNTQDKFTTLGQSVEFIYPKI